MTPQIATPDTDTEAPTVAEIVEAVQAGLTEYGYRTIRAQGGSHADAIKSIQIGVCAGQYANLLSRGITPAEIAEVKDAGIPLLPYASGRTNGFSHIGLVRIGTFAGASA